MRLYLASNETLQKKISDAHSWLLATSSVMHADVATDDKKWEQHVFLGRHFKLGSRSKYYLHTLFSLE